MTKTYETLIIERDGPAARVSLNRPGKRNSIGGPMMVELYGVLSELAADPGVRVLVLRGEGADFCPGADVKHYGGADAGAAAPIQREHDLREMIAATTPQDPLYAQLIKDQTGAASRWADNRDGLQRDVLAILTPAQRIRFERLQGAH